MKTLWLAAGLAVVAIGAYLATSDEQKSSTELLNDDSSAIVTVALPDVLSANAEIGKKVYDAKCVACHASNGEGQKGVAPPLVHKIYEPSHHGDEAFQRAAAAGVRAHHWKFGDMPPVEGLTHGDVAMIVTYIRELQVANGIN